MPGMSVKASPLILPARSRSAWLFAAAYIVAYVGLDWASYIRPLQGLNITPWNPQPALAIALLIWNRRRLGLVWSGLVAAELAVRGIPANWLAALSATVGLTLAYVAVARALSQRTDVAHPFATRIDLFWFAVIVTLGALMCALLYVLAFAATEFGPDNSLYVAVVRYWIGDAVGLVVTLPIFLILMHGAHRAVLAATLREPAWWLTALLTCACLWFVFGRGEQDYFKFFYLLLLPVVWAAARFGVTGAVLSSLLTQLGLIFAAQLALQHDLTLFELQALMVAATMTALLVGVLVDERTRAALELRSSLRFAAAGQMAAALAHELSQPLTALNNYARACRSLTDMPEGPDTRQREQLGADHARCRHRSPARRRRGEAPSRLLSKRDHFAAAGVDGEDDC